MATYAQTCLADSPGFLYLLNESSGNFADATANANTGVAHGAITYGVATGFPGQPKGITLGASGYIAAPHNAANNIISTTLSWEFAFGYAGSTISQPFLMAKGQDSAGGGYGVFLQTTGQFQIFATSSGLVINTGFIPTLDGTVRHFVLCRNGVAANTTLYVNGVSQTLGSTAGGAGVIGSQTAQYDLGAAFTTAGGVVEMFTGATLCCMSLYPSVLSPAQAAAHYAALIAAPAPPAPVKKSPPPSVVARVGKQPHPPQGGPKGQPSPQPSPIPAFGHLDGERRKREDQ